MEITTQSFNELVQKINNLTQKVNEFEIAEGYFSDILNNQLMIFSLIVLALVGLYLILIPRITRSQIKKESEETLKETKKELENVINKKQEIAIKELEEKFKKLDENFKKDIHEHDEEIRGLKGETYRLFAQINEDKNWFIWAFIWWMRAAEFFASTSIGETEARISLEGARRTVEKISYPELSSEEIGEYQRRFSNISDKLYKVEKDLLKRAFEEMSTRKPVAK